MIVIMVCDHDFSNPVILASYAYSGTYTGTVSLSVFTPSSLDYHVLSLYALTESGTFAGNTPSFGFQESPSGTSPITFNSLPTGTPPHSRTPLASPTHSAVGGSSPDPISARRDFGSGRKRSE
jgi:hypothetical protein